MSLLLVAMGMLASASDSVAFVSAQPVWPQGREVERNVYVGFRAVISAPECGQAVLRATGSTIYRAYVNGEYVDYGPARAAHGFYRIDEVDITSHLKPGDNVVAIEVAGYNSNSYYLMDQPSFLQAEVLANGKVLASTGGEGAPFEAHILAERIQKVQRYSFQRPASEVYDLFPGYDTWRSDPAAKVETVACATQAGGQLLPRRVALPRFDCRQPLMQIGAGGIETGVPVEKVWKDRSLRDIGPKLGGYPEAELVRIPSIELQSVRSVPGAAEPIPYDAASSVTLAGNSYATFDFGTNLTGFPGAQITVRKATRLFFTFDEILSNNDVDNKRMGSVNIVDLKLPEGTYCFEAFEPYTLRYL